MKRILLIILNFVLLAMFPLSWSNSQHRDGQRWYKQEWGKAVSDAQIKSILIDQQRQRALEEAEGR